MMRKNGSMKSEHKVRGFKGVWIPKEIYVDPDLSWSEKVLLIEIDQLDQDREKGCFASNKHLAAFLGVTVGTVKNLIVKLKKRGYVSELWRDGRHRGLVTVLRHNIPHKRMKAIGQEVVPHFRHQQMTYASRKNDIPASSNNDPFLIEKTKGEIQESVQPVAAPLNHSHSAESQNDLRSHPTIRALERLTGVLPDPILHSDFVSIIGDNPDEARLLECYKAWRERGARASNFSWVKEWYRAGNGNGLGPYGPEEPTGTWIDPKTGVAIV